jgi:hypothetical protein
LYTQVQVSAALHCSKGNRGASPDRNLLLRQDCTASQLVPLGRMATACQRFGAEGASEAFDLLIALVLLATPGSNNTDQPPQYWITGRIEVEPCPTFPRSFRACFALSRASGA